MRRDRADVLHEARVISCAIPTSCAPLMHIPALNRLLAVLVPALIIVTALPAAAQTKVRVIRDQATIWRPNFAIAAAVVAKGTELVVTGRQGMWYIVYLPSPPNTRQTGLIAENVVEPVGGTPPASRTVTPADAQGRGGSTTQPRPSTTPPARPPAGPVGLRAFGQVGYGWQTARDTFDALFGSPGGIWFGGGGDYSFRSGLFIDGSVDFSRRTGSRVFVYNDEVFDLGIDETVTMVPVMGTVGYRFTRRGAMPYIGGGIGSLIYKETSEFATGDEDVSRQLLSYHALGGVEWRTSRRMSIAVEVQYSHVPDDLEGGLGEAFDEHDLGGVQVRGKLLFGGR